MSTNVQAQVSARLHAARFGKLWLRLQRVGRRLIANRRFVRYGLVTLNVLLLGTIGWFAWHSTQMGQPLTQQAAASNTARRGNTSEPLDQLSSADIAANASLATRLPETTAVINQADSAKADLNVAPADTTVVAKPQAVATPLKSNKDIKEYVLPGDDTVANIAAKFNITSDSVMWSNNLTTSNVKTGTKLLIPPVNGIVYTVAGADTIDSIASKYRANRDQLVAYNDAEISGIHQGELIIIPNGQQPAPVVTYRAVTVATYGYNGYDFGFCTWYVATRRTQIGSPLPSDLGNASTWDYRASAFGMAVGKTPAVGAAVVTSHAGAGHVAFVEAVNADGSVWVSEMNSSGQVSASDATPRGGWGVVDWKLLSADTASRYNYIY